MQREECQERIHIRNTYNREKEQNAKNIYIFFENFIDSYLQCQPRQNFDPRHDFLTPSTNANSSQKLTQPCYPHHPRYLADSINIYSKSFTKTPHHGIECTLTQDSRKTPFNLLFVFFQNYIFKKGITQCLNWYLLVVLRKVLIPAFIFSSSYRWLYTFKSNNFTLLLWRYCIANCLRKPVTRILISVAFIMLHFAGSVYRYTYLAFVNFLKFSTW